MPTPEQLQPFVRQIDGETKPDLVPFYLKLRAAMSDHYSLERLSEMFTPRDMELLDAFRSEIPAAIQADAKVIDEMYRDLCERVDALDAEAVAKKVEELDKVQMERQESRARALIESLTLEAAAAVRAEAERLGRSIRGASNDVLAIARQYPDFVKERVRQQCAARGFVKGGPG